MWGNKVKNAYSKGHRNVNVRSAKRLAGDHRLPQAAIRNAMDAAKATVAKQKMILEIMNSKKNLRPMERGPNSSKGDLNMKQWAKTPQGTKLKQHFETE